MPTAAPRLRPSSGAVAVLAACLLGTLPAAAEEGGGIVIGRSVAKAATYQVLSSANDFAFGYLVAGSAMVGGAMALITTVSEPVFYMVHELAWEAAIDGTGIDETSLIGPRTATYAAINAGRVFGTGMLLTGSPVIAAGYVAVSMVGDSAAFALNDLAWSTLLPRSTGPAAGAAAPAQ